VDRDHHPYTVCNIPRDFPRNNTEEQTQHCSLTSKLTVFGHSTGIFKNSSMWAPIRHPQAPVTFPAQGTDLTLIRDVVSHHHRWTRRRIILFLRRQSFSKTRNSNIHCCAPTTTLQALEFWAIVLHPSSRCTPSPHPYAFDQPNETNLATVVNMRWVSWNDVDHSARHVPRFDGACSLHLQGKVTRYPQHRNYPLSQRTKTRSQQVFGLW
jgi:hypothetical protein